MRKKHFEKFPKKHGITSAAVVLLLLAALAGCSDSAESSSSVSAEQTVSQTESSSSYEDEPQSAQSDISSESSSLSTGTSSAESSENTEMSENSSEDSSDESVPTENPQTSAESSSDEVIEPQPSVPVQVVIPDINVPLSPGTDVITADCAVVDYSNASEGYISVRYFGSKAKAKLRVVCGSETYDHDVDTDGTTDYFPLSCGSGSYTITLYEQVEGTKYIAVLSGTIEADISDTVGVYLYPNRYVYFSKSSACVGKAAELCAGQTDSIGKIAAVFVWVTDNITYDKELAATVRSGYIPDPDTVLSKGKGICFDYASLVAAMLRSQGIPTRLVVGYASPDIYHAWNEVYTEQTGWITVSLLLEKYGYNIVDATFYAGASDKAAISEYISNDDNYSAIYYY